MPMNALLLEVGNRGRFDGRFDGHMDRGAWWMVIGVVVPLAIALIVGAVAYGVFRRRGPTGVIGADAVAWAPAQAILDERIARGEIDPDEYATRSQALRSWHVAGASTMPEPPDAETADHPA